MPLENRSGFSCRCIAQSKIESLRHISYGSNLDEGQLAQIDTNEGNGGSLNLTEDLSIHFIPSSHVHLGCQTVKHLDALFWNRLDCWLGLVSFVLAFLATPCNADDTFHVFFSLPIGLRFKAPITSINPLKLFSLLRFCNARKQNKWKETQS